MRIGFVTCVQLGLSCMEAIDVAGGKIDVAFTLHDELAPQKSGRVWIDDFCDPRDIPLVKLRNINDGELFDSVRQFDVDWLFIIGWSQIARAEVLNGPKRGVLGMHPTLLPEGRGRASVPWAILKGLTRTGVTLFKLDDGVDTGPIVAQEIVSLGPDETATTLYPRIAEAHAVLIRNVWPKLVADSLVLTPQDESRASLWPGRTPEEGRILPSMTVAEVDRLVRAVTRPYPGAFFDQDGSRSVVWAGSVVELADSQPIKLADGNYWATETEMIG